MKKRNYFNNFINTVFINKEKKLIKYSNYLSNFALKYLKKTHCEGYILGISGGIDSALALKLLKLSMVNILPVFIDIKSSWQDRNDAVELAKNCDVDLKIINLTSIYLQLVDSLNIKNDLAKNNLKVRLRMIVLYALAAENNYLVCGTSNADELLLGYATKYGDLACDVSLLCKLIKSQVVFLANYYKLPESIINKKPSAGLFANQEDEKEMGIKYNEIDAFLLHKFVNFQIEDRISVLNRRNSHKFNKPVAPKNFVKLRNKKYE